MTSAPRADLFLALAECFAPTQNGFLVGPPLWMAAPAQEWPLFAYLMRVASDSSAARCIIQVLSEIPPETVEQRQARYDTLFIRSSGAPRHWLYESAAKTGRILGPQTFAIAKIYHAAGLETKLGAELPDHASLELSFLAYLAECAENDLPNAADWRALERRFLKEHGDWLIQLGRDLSASGDEVYAPIGAFLADWLSEVLTITPFPLGEGRGMMVPTVPSAEDCTLCGFCVQICPAHALAVRESESETLLVLNAPLCIGCGKCEKICETKALVLTPKPFLGGGGAGDEVILRQSPRSGCPACGKPTVSRAELEYVGARLGSPAWLDYCLDCRPQFFRG